MIAAVMVNCVTTKLIHDNSWSFSTNISSVCERNMNKDDSCSFEINGRLFDKRSQVRYVAIKLDENDTVFLQHRDFKKRPFGYAKYPPNYGEVIRDCGKNDTICMKIQIAGGREKILLMKAKKRTYQHRNLFVPLTLAFDIATLPFQLLIFILSPGSCWMAGYMS